MSQGSPKDTVVHTSRLLPAAPGEVFAAFEDPEKLAVWWGPAGFTNTFSTFDFTPGGKWIFTMHAPNGSDFLNESFFREIEKDRRIVIEHVVRPWFTLTVTLTPEGQGTLLAWNQEFENPEIAATMRTLSETANEQVLDRLQALLAGN
ncbi:MAG: polyketide cyclase [Verrucomicrobiaceae bacterium]|nr:MAG: polyketide cyclase [Verrucomicrobiaceae bacterium]